MGEQLVLCVLQARLLDDPPDLRQALKSERGEKPPVRQPGPRRAPALLREEVSDEDPGGIDADAQGHALDGEPSRRRAVDVQVLLGHMDGAPAGEAHGHHRPVPDAVVFGQAFGPARKADVYPHARGRALRHPEAEFELVELAEVAGRRRQDQLSRASALKAGRRAAVLLRELPAGGGDVSCGKERFLPDYPVQLHLLSHGISPRSGLSSDNWCSGGARQACLSPTTAAPAPAPGSSAPAQSPG